MCRSLSEHEEENEIRNNHNNESDIKLNQGNFILSPSAKRENCVYTSKLVVDVGY